MMHGGVIWFGSCAIGNDTEVNYARAEASGCYIVAPCMYMQPKPGQKGHKRCPASKIDMYPRFQPRVFSPDRTPISYASFLGKQQLGIRVSRRPPSLHDLALPVLAEDARLARENFALPVGKDGRSLRAGGRV
jgi:hypothetical protein